MPNISCLFKQKSMLLENLLEVTENLWTGVFFRCPNGLPSFKLHLLQAFIFLFRIKRWLACYAWINMLLQ